MKTKREVNESQCHNCRSHIIIANVRSSVSFYDLMLFNPNLYIKWLKLKNVEYFKLKRTGSVDMVIKLVTRRNKLQTTIGGLAQQIFFNLPFDFQFRIFPKFYSFTFLIS